MDRYELGRAGENYACAYLVNEGYEIISRNLHVGYSEFDIICKKDNCIVFVEVKTRNASPQSISRFGAPRRAVDQKKSNALIRGALQYLKDNDLRGVRARIDVIEIYASTVPTFCIRKLNHFKNAVKRRTETY